MKTDILSWKQKAHKNIHLYLFNAGGSKLLENFVQGVMGRL
jgi:hypothetical protein